MMSCLRGNIRRLRINIVVLNQFIVDFYDKVVKLFFARIISSDNVLNSKKIIDFEQSYISHLVNQKQ